MSRGSRTKQWGLLINSPLNRRRLRSAQLSSHSRGRFSRLALADQVLLWKAVALVATITAICAATPWRALAEWGVR